MSSPTTTTRRAASIALALVLALGYVPAAAQPEPPGEVELQLVRQPAFHEARDRLGISVLVHNSSEQTLQGFALQVRSYARIETRSDLEASLDIDQTRVESSSFRHEESETLEPGRAATVELDQRLDVPGTLVLGDTTGIYPVTVTLTSPEGLVVHDSVTTFLIYLPSAIESPLKVVPLWVVGEVPARGPGGAFHPHPLDGRRHLEAAVTENGWLTTTLDALSSRAGERLRLGVVPVPRTVEELAVLSEGYERETDGEIDPVGPSSPVARGASAALDDLRSLLAQDRAQSILTPYAFADIPSLTGDLDLLQLQLQEGERILEQLLRVTPDRSWVLPPAGRLDDDALDDLHGLQAAESSFFAAQSIGALIDPFDECTPPFSGGTFTCPALVETLAGETRGYVFDPQLQRRVQALGPTTGRVALQRLFAELAMIWAELPSDPDRVVALVLPSLIHLRPRAARLVIRTLARAPWLETLTPLEGLQQGIGTAAREPTDGVRQIALTADESYRTAISGAEAALAEYARVEPPSERFQRLTRTFLVAQSRFWDGDPILTARAEQFARAVADEVGDEFGKISLGGQRDITLTSRAGELPLVLRNDTGYDVTLDIELAWRDLDLRIDQSDIRQTFPPGVSPVPIEAAAEGSGIFLVQVTISTPDGRAIATEDISIRSTEFNELALAITLGALAFLVLFYLFRAFGRRNKVATT